MICQNQIYSAWVIFICSVMLTLTIGDFKNWDKSSHWERVYIVVVGLFLIFNIFLFYWSAPR